MNRLYRRLAITIHYFTINLFARIRCANNRILTKYRFWI